MAANIYHRGNSITADATFTDANGVEADPTTSITFLFKDPALLTTVYVFGVDAELVKDAAGKFHVDIDLDQEGNWYCRFEGVDPAGNAATEQLAVVQQGHFSP